MDSVREKLEGLDLRVYSATWCPDCNRLKDWLDQQGVGYQLVEIDHDDGAAEFLEKETGKRAIPFVHVNGQVWVRGYHKEDARRFVPEVLVEELLEAKKEN